jgi:cob(I)alamin adenosyltransferase
MRSISTGRGDGGQTSLGGGARASKASLRVEAYGAIDELNSAMGFARSICQDAEMRQLVKSIQRELFMVGSAISTPPNSKKKPPEITTAMVKSLTDNVRRLESIEGILSDWSLPGEHPVSAAFDMARTVCRRAERSLVRLIESEEQVSLNALAYLNRLSDLLWLIGRKVELDAGVDSSLRDPEKGGPRWSRAW